MALQLERKRESVYMCYLVLLLTPSGTKRLSTPIILFMSRHVWQVLSCSSGMVNVGAHNTVWVLTRLEGCIVPV